MRLIAMLLVAYTVASLLHFTHNAEFLADYPNMPASITRANVYGTWLAIGAVGLAGYVLVRRGWEVAGLSLIALYAVLGFDGLAHYTLAPMSAHTFIMNFTIWLEVAAAALLLAATSILLGQRVKAWRS
jgi:hypothetical protein